MVSVASDHACALLEDKTVKCWGNNDDGQLGNGTTTDSNIPVPVPGLTDVTAVFADRKNTCALLIDKTAKCWGDNYYGQLGNGRNIDSNTPVIVSNLSGIVSFSLRGDTACALLEDKTVKCWGSDSNFGGKLGKGTNGDSSSPVSVSNLTNVAAIFIDKNNACAILGDSTAKCWGSNQSGQLGNGTTINSNIPVPVSL